MFQLHHKKHVSIIVITHTSRRTRRNLKAAACAAAAIYRSLIPDNIATFRQAVDEGAGFQRNSPGYRCCKTNHFYAPSPRSRGLEFTTQIAYHSAKLLQDTARPKCGAPGKQRGSSIRNATRGKCTPTACNSLYDMTQ